MNLPKPIRGGSLYDWALRAWEAIRACRVDVGPGLQIARSSTGAVISLSRPPAAAALAAAWQFRALKKDGEGGFSLTLRPGWVREVLPKGGDGADAVAYHLPVVAGQPMDADPAPELALAPGQYACVKFATDPFGNIKSGGGDVVELIAADEDLASTHYQPPDSDGAGGLDGLCHVRIGRLVAGEGSAPPSWQPMTHGYIDHVHELWTGKNLGDGAAIYKKRDVETDKYEFRKIHARFGLSHEEAADQVELDFDAESVGGGVDVYLAPPLTGSDPLPDEKAKFASLRGLSYDEAAAESVSAQIQVTSEDGEGPDSAGKKDTIRIRGNGAKGSRFAGTANEIAWQDGLVTSTGDEEAEGGGWSGEITLKDCYPLTEYENPADPSTWIYFLRVAVRDGRIVGVNETAEARAFHETVINSYVQSCSFYGTDPEDQR